MAIQRLSLDGAWGLQKNGRGRKIDAKVPGDVYADLLAAREVPDPFYRDNELDLQWIGESNWRYSRSFNVTKELLSHQHLLLRCEGLDTFAAVTINGTLVAETENMFRTYEWDVQGILKPGRNSIQIDFTSVLPYIAARSKKHPAWEIQDYKVAYPGWVRKEQCNFGWDWGIKAVTCGIWRDIQILAFDEGRVTDVNIQQRHERGHVELDVGVSMSGSGKGLRAEFTVRDGDQVVAMKRATVLRRRAGATVAISNPRLWWPNTMGEPHLYTVTVALLNTKGCAVDTVTKRIGLRTLELDRHDDEWGESFQFVVNGVPFFAKGANWIPVDAILARRSPEQYHRLVRDAAACNMNMLRVWGGGIYEDDCFYDACDELGICVWQDFMFACAAYPTFQKGFLANVKAEARDAIRRLRHHPSMALWCGNNELEMMNVSDAGWQKGMMPWRAYQALFDELLPKQVAELSPDIPYWPSSPHTPKGDRKQHRSPACGDAHLWILNGMDPITGARVSDHRFASEFGYQSFPEPKTVNGYTLPSDRNIASRIMEHHQRAPGGNITLAQQMLKVLRMPTGFENSLLASQILQGVGVKHACEHFRRSMPHTMGALYWQLNDCWPVASWASIDCHGRWKALQYMSRHFFAPLLISGVDDREKGTVEVHLTSDRLKTLDALASWTITDVQGEVLGRGSRNVKTPRNASRKIATIRLHKLLTKHPLHDLLVWLDVHVEGEQTQRNLVFLAPPKHLELSSNPRIHKSIRRKRDGAFVVGLTCEKVALWAWIELDSIDAELSDNFVHLRPGVNRSIEVRPARQMTMQEFRKSVVIQSLVDTY